MKKFIIFLGVLLLPGAAFAALSTLQFNNGDSLSAWSVDRSAPAGFAIVNNQLKMTIDGSTEGNTSNFADTRGMRLNLGQVNYLSIDMFVDSSWANAGERYGGIWAVGYSGFFNSNGWGSKTYPILEYQVDSAGTGGIAQWDSYNGWGSSLSSLFNMDEFNNFKFIIADAGVEYYINDTLIKTDILTQTEYFTDVILNAKNEGSDFTVLYDNLTYGKVSVPESGALAIFLIGLAGLSFKAKKRK